MCGHAWTRSLTTNAPTVPRTQLYALMTHALRGRVHQLQPRHDRWPALRRSCCCTSHVHDVVGGLVDEHAQDIHEGDSQRTRVYPRAQSHRALARRARAARPSPRALVIPPTPRPDGAHAAAAQTHAQVIWREVTYTASGHLTRACLRPTKQFDAARGARSRRTRTSGAAEGSHTRGATLLEAIKKWLRQGGSASVADPP